MNTSDIEKLLNQIKKISRNPTASTALLGLGFSCIRDKDSYELWKIVVQYIEELEDKLYSNNE